MKGSSKVRVDVGFPVMIRAEPLLGGDVEEGLRRPDEEERGDDCREEIVGHNTYFRSPRG